VLRGADALRAAVLDPSHSGRHFTTDCLITVTGASASQRCQLIELGIDDEQPVVRRYGRYDDRLVRTEAGWRFARRRLEYAGVR
jgi:anthranilate 1,2-dioxygenase small subunit